MLHSCSTPKSVFSSSFYNSLLHLRNKPFYYLPTISSRLFRLPNIKNCIRINKRKVFAAEETEKSNIWGSNKGRSREGVFLPNRNPATDVQKFNWKEPSWFFDKPTARCGIIQDVFIRQNWGMLLKRHHLWTIESRENI